MEKTPLAFWVLEMICDYDSFSSTGPINLVTMHGVTTFLKYQDIFKVSTERYQTYNTYGQINTQIVH